MPESQARSLTKCLILQIRKASWVITLVFTDLSSSYFALSSFTVATQSASHSKLEQSSGLINNQVVLQSEETADHTSHI